MKFSSRKDADNMNSNNRINVILGENDENKCPMPHRACDNILDPLTGFVSVSGDVDRGTGHTHIPCTVQLNTTPQSRTPQEISSFCSFGKFVNGNVPGSSAAVPGTTSTWNSRKVLDASARAYFAGCGSEAELRLQDKQQLLTKPADENRILRDRLAHRYVYSSSTQRAFEQVTWEGMPSAKQNPPITTLEPKADIISTALNTKRYDNEAAEWQKIGRAWDRAQTRRGYYKSNLPIPGFTFCSPCPRVHQIPGYGGCIGAQNLEEVDNEAENFVPLTVKRNCLPWPTDTAHRPNIPNYAGCTWYRGDSAPAHQNPTEPMSTTHRIHRPMIHYGTDTSFRRQSCMSKMMTTVPPHNPFTKVTTPGERISVK